MISYKEFLRFARLELVHITTKIIQFDGKSIRKSGFLWFGQESAKDHLLRLLKEVDDDNKNEVKHTEISANEYVKNNK